jgi:hypothetical protein
VFLPKIERLAAPRRRLEAMQIKLALLASQTRGMIEIMV